MSEEKRTEFAMRALGFAEIFQVTFGAELLRGLADFRVEMSAPDGPSTAGGKQVLQHVKLIPEGGGSVTVAGSANTVERRAELRAYELLAESHRARFKGAELPFDRAPYEALVKKLQTFFAQQSMQVVLLQATPSAPPAAPAKSRPLLWAFAALVALLAAAAIFLLLHKRGS